jgi:hypothetical protein
MWSTILPVRLSNRIGFRRPTPTYDFIPRSATVRLVFRGPVRRVVCSLGASCRKLYSRNLTGRKAARPSVRDRRKPAQTSSRGGKLSAARSPRPGGAAPPRTPRRMPGREPRTFVRPRASSVSRSEELVGRTRRRCDSGSFKQVRRVSTLLAKQSMGGGQRSSYCLSNARPQRRPSW